MKKSISVLVLVFISSLLSFGQLEIKRIGSFILFKQDETICFVAEQFISSIAIEKEEVNIDRSHTQRDKPKATTRKKIVIYTTQKDGTNTFSDGNNRFQPANENKKYSFVIDEADIAAYLDKLTLVLANKKLTTN
jgi:hypothetical protein